MRYTKGMKRTIIILVMSLTVPVASVVAFVLWWNWVFRPRHLTGKV